MTEGPELDWESLAGTIERRVMAELDAKIAARIEQYFAEEAQYEWAELESLFRAYHSRLVRQNGNEQAV